MSDYERETDDPPKCVTCRYKHRLTVESPCYGCIDLQDLARHAKNADTNFANYEKEVETNE